MRALIVKLSSMGDIIHTLPAVTDASKKLNIKFDWVIEPGFAEIPNWHYNVHKIYNMPLRKWKLTSKIIIATINEIRNQQYDYIIDAQGLIKSAVLTKLCKGTSYGLNYKSAKEPIASFFYNNKIKIYKNQHAIERTRTLFAKIFGYPIKEPTDYGISNAFNEKKYNKNYIVFLHATTWQTKHWPLHNWIKLAKQITDHGIEVLIPWSNQIEYLRASKIASTSKNIKVLPKMSLKELGSVLQYSIAVVSVDTGLGHLATALNVPTIGIYGPTSTTKSGIIGPKQMSFYSKLSCAPCLKKKCRFNEKNPMCFYETTPHKIWQQLLPHLENITVT